LDELVPHSGGIFVDLIIGNDWSHSFILHLIVQWSASSAILTSSSEQTFLSSWSTFSFRLWRQLHWRSPFQLSFIVCSLLVHLPSFPISRGVVLAVFFYFQLSGTLLIFSTVFPTSTWVRFSCLFEINHFSSSGRTNFTLFHFHFSIKSRWAISWVIF